MCGIVGIIGDDNASNIIIQALKRLEYRGYDSSGIATISDDKIHLQKSKGKISNLEEKLSKTKLQGSVAIGHTRWATHGTPTEENAHPHANDKVAIVHNGIIENHQTLRAVLESDGYVFSSETDSEVILHLIDSYLSKDLTPEEAVQQTIAKLQGSYALGVIFADYPEMMIAARSGSPLAIGYSDSDDKVKFIGSDAFALAPFCNKISYLEEGDMAVINPDNVHVFNHKGQSVERTTRSISQDISSSDKGGYPHYMLKEIHEQPMAIANTTHAFYNGSDDSFNFAGLPISADDISRITMIACGTSYYATQVARYWFEQISRIPTSIDIASEFRYRKPILPANGLSIFISQSGETADTLAALRYCQSIGQKTLALVNVEESSMAMEADSFIKTHAGIEIGVASTKAFTTQLVTLGCLAVMFAKERKTISSEEAKTYMFQLGKLPDLAGEVLDLSNSIKAIAKTIKDSKDMLYIGRGTSFGIASEGALKMKELSYIHAEGYAAGELKHGPLALIDDEVPVVVVAPRDDLFDKTISNLQETAARGGRIILISDAQAIHDMKGLIAGSVTMPTCNSFIAPMLYALPLQLLAYHTAVLKETDVDQPRNLAKSVTVE